MKKCLKTFILVFLILFFCTAVTFSNEPNDTNNTIQTSDPMVEETIPPKELVPVTEPPLETESELEAALKQQASDFYTEVEAIVVKRIDSFHKNGGKGTLGIYIKELESGFEYSYNAEKTNPDNPQEGYFKSASTCKLLSASVMYYLNSCGELELDKSYTDTVTKKKYNLKKILPKMISHSVNDYFNITLRHLGSEKINETLKKLGLDHSIIYSEIMPAEYSSVKNNIKRYGISRSPRTTPKDLGHALDLLYSKKTFGAENDSLFLKSLLDNIYSNRLPAGIGYKSPVAHKTGTSSNEGVFNDAGIILLKDNPYIMIVMSSDSSSNVQSLQRTITGDIYQYMKKRTENQSPILE